MSAVEMSAGSIGSLHGDNSCFLPLKQLDQDYFAPRIVQVGSFLANAIRFCSFELWC